MFKNLIIDKGSDVLVVTIGVLLALSVGSCREKLTNKREWNSFNSHTTRIVTLELEATNKSLNEYEESIKTGRKLSDDLINKKVNKEDLSSFLQTFAQISIDYPTSNLYDAFLKLNNPYLTKDYDYFATIDAFYNFSKVADIYLNLYLDQFIPEFRLLHKEYKLWQDDIDYNKDPVLAEKIIYLIRSRDGILQGLKYQVNEQAKRAKKILKYGLN